MRLIRIPYSTVSLTVRTSWLMSAPVRLIAMILLVTVSTSSCTSMRPIRAASAPTAPKEYWTSSQATGSRWKWRTDAVHDSECSVWTATVS